MITHTDNSTFIAEVVGIYGKDDEEEPLRVDYVETRWDLYRCDLTMLFYRFVNRHLPNRLGLEGLPHEDHPHREYLSKKELRDLLNGASGVGEYVTNILPEKSKSV